MLTCKTFVVIFFPNFFIAIVNCAVVFIAIASRSFLFSFHFLLFSPILSIYRSFSLLLFSRLSHVSHFFILHLSISICNYFIMKRLEKNVNPIGYLLQIRNIIAKNTRLNAYIIHIRWYRIIGRQTNRTEIEENVDSSRLSVQVCECNIPRVALTVRRNRDKALWFCIANSTYIFRESIIDQIRSRLTKKQKGKYRVFRSIKYTCVYVWVRVCVCECVVRAWCVHARMRVYVYMCICISVEWNCKRAVTFFFF